MNNYSDILIPNIRTTVEKNELLAEVSSAKEIFFKTGSDIERELKSTMSDWVYNVFVDQKAKGTDFLHFSEDIEKLLESLPRRS